MWRHQKNHVTETLRWIWKRKKKKKKERIPGVCWISRGSVSSESFLETPQIVCVKSSQEPNAHVVLKAQNRFVPEYMLRGKKEIKNKRKSLGNKTRHEFLCRVPPLIITRLKFLANNKLMRSRTLSWTDRNAQTKAFFGWKTFAGRGPTV